MSEPRDADQQDAERRFTRWLDQPARIGRHRLGFRNVHLLFHGAVLSYLALLNLIIRLLKWIAPSTTAP